MKERPIIFNSDNVRAILEGRKIQTRRVVKPEWKKLIHDFDRAVPGSSGYILHVPVHHPEEPDFSDQRVVRIYCPYQVGDRLWVREAFWKDDSFTFYYKATPPPLLSDLKKWISPIFMPRWASRITLEIVRVRVERLQGVTYSDVEAEGISCKSTKQFVDWSADYMTEVSNKFKALWDSLNAKRGYPWESNPWVWVIEFLSIK